ncbi:MULTISPECIES: hypothetical protein [Vibrio]|uniref:hypothetical protein n=1 Tax=Vibrio TaxID=662 RepID=UPI0010BD399D|nr:hypothetical protein [Vibrio sp. F12]TKE77653.1 hypothetical protein FCV54_19315 [Vibrio sp. F12]
MALKSIPFKLVETWFWMAFSCKESAINEAGKLNIEKHFSDVREALEKHPALQRNSQIDQRNFHS